MNMRMERFEFKIKLLNQNDIIFFDISCFQPS